MIANAKRSNMFTICRIRFIDVIIAATSDQ